MISLDRLLDGLDVEVDPLRVYHLPSGRRLDGGQINAPTVHCTQSGSGLLELAGGTTIRFSRQRVMVVPARRPARIAPEATAGEPDVLIACVRIRATYAGSVGLFDDLREPLVEDLSAHDPVRRSFDELLDEVAAQRPGYRAMVETLMRRCLILVLRRCLAHDDRRLSWLAALEDARLGRAVSAMQDRPEQPFTLSGLALVAGMSRSAFAARFADAFGQSPIEFLKTIRLGRAAQLLTHTDLPVKTVAARVGYSSRSSFTRAFLGRHGIGPTGFRTAARKPAAA